MPDPQRLPLAVKPSNRDETTDRDAKIVNGYVERVGERDVEVYKRPGVALFENSGTAAAGLGSYNWNGDLFTIFGTKVYKNNVVLSGTVDGTAIYSFTSTLGTAPQLVFQNGVKMYTYDTTNGIVEVQSSAAVVVTGDISTGSAVVTAITPDTTGLFENMYVTGAGIPDFTRILTVDSTSQVTLDNNATATTTGVSLTFETGFPSSRVPGIAYLDGYIEVMTPDATIWSSDANEPNSWALDSNIVAQIEADQGVYISKQLVYVLAFKKYSVEMFYDAGNATGSPLSPVQGAKVSVGCRHANSVAQMEGTIFWVSQARDGGTAVYLMDNVKPAQISTPPIERLLQQADYTTVYSWCALSLIHI